MCSLYNKLKEGRPKLRVRNPVKVDALLTALVADGADKLQLVDDFDSTLTRAHKNGNKVDHSWGVLDNSSMMSKEYSDAATALSDTYVPISQDLNMSVEEKARHMIRWYKASADLMGQQRIKRTALPRMVSDSTVDFRDDTDTMLSSLSAAGIPVLILSAGLGDLVLEICKFKNVLYDNIKVMSNFLKYDSNGVIVGFEDPDNPIHPFNKNESSAHFQLLRERTNVILLGDNVGDVNMAEGVGTEAVVLKIGFLNHAHNIEDMDMAEKRTEAFLDAGYDIVLVDDQTMDVPNWILERVLTANKIQ